MILVGKIVHTLAELQDDTLYFINMSQLTMAHMFQDQFFNKVQKASTMQNLLKEWI